MGRNARENRVKVQISVDSALLKKIDDFCDSNYMSRSGFLSLSASQMMSASEVAGLLRQMNGLLTSIVESRDLDEQTRSDLDNLSRLASLLGSSALGSSSVTVR